MCLILIIRIQYKSFYFSYHTSITTSTISEESTETSSSLVTFTQLSTASVSPTSASSEELTVETTSSPTQGT
jgi:hypothetical protein